NDIVTATAYDMVPATSPNETVPAISACYIFKTREDIACCVATAGGPLAEIYRDGRCCTLIAQRVTSLAAIHCVGTFAAVHDVVAAETIQDIVAQTAHNPVGKRRARNCFISDLLHGANIDIATNQAQATSA